MRIGIDARVLTGEMCGVANYLCKLIRELLAQDPALELVLFAPEPIRPEFLHFLEHPRVCLVTLSLSKHQRKSWPARYLPRLLRQHGVEVFHQPFNADGALFAAPCPVVVTIHDLIPWVLEGFFRTWSKALRYKIHNWLWVRLAKKVLTVSENSKKDIMRLCRVSGDKIAVTHLGADGIDDGVVSESEAAAILAKHGLAGKRYVVNIGGLNQKRRHPDFILEGFARFRRETGRDLYLVFTGSIMKFDGFYDAVMQKIAALGIADRVVTTGYLPNKDLKVIVSGAEVSVVTSLYEGFCLPVVESFACGVPVIANDRGSVPEIAGEAATLIGPYDPAGLSRALTAITGDDRVRLGWVEKGLLRVKAFSWVRMAADTLRVYREVLGKKVSYGS